VSFRLSVTLSIVALASSELENWARIVGLALAVAAAVLVELGKDQVQPNDNQIMAHPGYPGKRQKDEGWLRTQLALVRVPTEQEFGLEILDAKEDLDFARTDGDQLKIDLCEAALNDLLDRYYHQYHHLEMEGQNGRGT